ncbi:hypothetical protein LguiB_028292 [Lonicera macranthoides]
MDETVQGLEDLYEHLDLGDGSKNTLDFNGEASEVQDQGLQWSIVGKLPAMEISISSRSKMKTKTMLDIPAVATGQPSRAARRVDLGTISLIKGIHSHHNANSMIAETKKLMDVKKEACQGNQVIKDIFKSIENPLFNGPQSNTQLAISKTMFHDKASGPAQIIGPGLDSKAMELDSGGLINLGQDNGPDVLVMMDPKKRRKDDRPTEDMEFQFWRQ